MLNVFFNRENSTSKEPKSSQPPEKKPKTLAEAKSNVTSVAKPPTKTKIIAALPKRTLFIVVNIQKIILNKTAKKIADKGSI
jgi:hypothetical protein